MAYEEMNDITKRRTCMAQQKKMPSDAVGTLAHTKCGSAYVLGHKVGECEHRSKSCSMWSTLTTAVSDT